MALGGKNKLHTLTLPPWPSAPQTNPEGRQNDKRKKSSDSSEVQSKQCRVGGSTEGPEVSDNVCVSDLLKQSNDVLFNTDSVLNVSDAQGEPDPNISLSSVFDSSETTRSISGPQTNMAATQCDEITPSNGDIMSMLKSMNSKM